MRSPLTGLTAYRCRNTPDLAREESSRSISETCLTFSRYSANSASAGVPAASSAARSESAATTKNVAPYSVSGRVV